MAKEPDKPEASEESGHYNALPKGYQLHEYRLDAVLGVGGFGITYLAWDENLNKRVAIKEYLPSDFAVRAGEVTVQPRSGSDREDYQWGLDRFMEEAQMLARFQHKSIVQVFRFFQAHGTAYMVMNYEEGQSFAEVMEREKGTIDEEALLNLVLPLLDGLGQVHAAKVLHRDVKPGNIYIRADGSPVLLDFGAARDQIGRKSKGLTSIVTPGYAPLEQYHTDGNQGPWTDIYSMGAILYQAISGKLPPEAPARVKVDAFEPASEIGSGRYSAAFLGAIDWALQVDEDTRPHSVEDWREALSGVSTAAAPAGNRTMVVGKSATLRPAGRPDTAPARGRKSGALVWVAVAVLAFVATAAGGWFAADRTGLLDGLTGTAGDVAPPADTPAPPAETPAQTAETPADDETPTTSPEDSTINLPRTSEKPIERPTPPPDTGAGEEAERKAAEDAKRKAAEEAKRQAAEEIRRQDAEDAKRRAAEEAKRRAAEDAKRQTEDAKRQAEEATRRGAEIDAKERAELERRVQDAERRAQEAERKAAEAAKRRAQEAERKAREAERKAQEAAERRAREAERKAKIPPSPPPQTARLVSCPFLLPALGAQLPVRDCSSVSGLLNFVLENKRTGQGGSWRSRDNRYSGTIVPVQTYTRPDGIPCRRFSQTVKIKGRTRRAEGTACRSRSSAEWRIVL